MARTRESCSFWELCIPGSSATARTRPPWIRTSAAFRKALALKPGYLEAHRNAAELYSRLRRHEEAIIEYTRVLQIEPGSPESIVNLLYEKANICQWDDMDQWLNKLRDLDIRGREIKHDRSSPGLVSTV